MRIIALIIVVFLVSPGWVGAVEPASQIDLATASESQEVRSFTGIIMNKTPYEVSIPSENSDATVVIPPHAWIKYTIWDEHLKVTAYHHGEPFYCLNIFARPQEYPFMCKKYDFVAEIALPEPARRYRPILKRPFKKKGDQGVEALG
jgi:hypothetical protein